MDWSKTRSSPISETFSENPVLILMHILFHLKMFISEFVAESYMRTACILGFTGSAGTAVVTRHKAALWTDGRYFLQAAKRLNSSWIIIYSDCIVPTQVSLKCGLRLESLLDMI